MKIERKRKKTLIMKMKKTLIFINTIQMKMMKMKTRRERTSVDDAELNADYSLFLTRLAEKLMQLSIAFITQYFPEGDDLYSPLVHFVDVIGNASGRFNQAYHYTSYVAGLMWVSQLLVM